MSKHARSLLIKYCSCAVFVAIMAYFYISPRNFAAATLLEKYWILCDALTIPGMLLIMAGAMIWVSNLGALDGIGYILSMLGRSLVPGMRAKADEKFADYVERKREKAIRGYGFLFIAGGVTMAAALVFMALFFSVS